MPATSPISFAKAEGPDPVDLTQVWCGSLGAGLEFDSEFVDVDDELPDAFNELGCYARDHAVESGQPVGCGAEMLERGQRAQVWIPRRVDLVKVPSEPVDVPCPFCYQVFSVVNEQAKFPSSVVEMGRGQVWFA